ncbi:RES family NAD+ phosphorylase [Azospirillum sp. YIM DDC1]|uniref:RES family NAD+ phosphorylase n=1 Tax=Azospirillum aestuarii TaxID=2802052 RepID=A0ABS1I6V5_9PROT|nr:RES family NAD+ phosphorylase [Azospirillum aestuarii]MBK4722393.1 RES family NAD+ phosphorylase [Azospirillum aestuarii]
MHDHWKDRWSSIETVSRLAQRRYSGNAAAALDGNGGLYVPGRWNNKGQRVVYTASSRALAMLERLVHLDVGLHDASVELSFMEFVLPSSVSRNVLSPTMLENLVAKHGSSTEPPDWRVADHPLCRRLGAAWIASLRSCLLIIPSSIVPGDANVLINPEHPDMAKIIAANAGRFVLDAYQPDQRIADVVQMASVSKTGS